MLNRLSENWGPRRRSTTIALFACLLICLFAPMLQAQGKSKSKKKKNKAAETATYNPAALNVWGNGFIPGSSSTSASAQCPSASAPSCAENFSNAVGAGVGFQYRALRNLEGGVDFDLLGNFGGFGTQAAASGAVTQKTNVLGTMITTSARAVLPLFDERLLISGGAGLALLFADINPSGNEQFSGCYSCRSRRGHGPIEMAEVIYFPDQGRHFGIGFRVAPVQITTTGGFSAATAGANPNQIFKDHFLLIGGGVSLRFGGKK